MSSVVIKLGSLVIRTLSKPIANKIKEQAREHERFRRICFQSAQAIHRWDMRFKLGLLQDSASQERQAKREAAEAQAKKHKHEIPTVKTEGQTIAEDAAAAAKDKEDGGKEKAKDLPKPKVKIRPLSEAKAIDSGANFVSETFLLLVGVALILGENWRQSRKQKNRREDVAERMAELEEDERNARKGLVVLEKEILRLRAMENNGPIKPQERILPKEVYELEEREEREREPKEQGWWGWLKEKTVRGGSESVEGSSRPEVTPAESVARPQDEKTSTTAPSQPASSSIFSKILPSRAEDGLPPKQSTAPTEQAEGALKASNQKAVTAVDSLKR